MNIEKMRREADYELDHFEFGYSIDIVKAESEWSVVKDEHFIRFTKMLGFEEESDHEPRQRLFTVLFTHDETLYCAE